MWIFETVMLILIIVLIALILFFRFYFYLDGYGKYILVSTTPCIQNKKYNVYQCEGDAPCLDHYGQTLSYNTKLEEVSCSPNDALNNITGQQSLNRIRPDIIPIGDTHKVFGRSLTREVNGFYLDGQQVDMEHILTLKPEKKHILTLKPEKKHTLDSREEPRMSLNINESYLFSHACHSELYKPGTLNNKKCYKIPSPITLVQITINDKYLIKFKNEYKLVDDLEYHLRLLNLSKDMYLKTHSPYFSVLEEGLFIFDSLHPGWFNVIEGRIIITSSPSPNNFEYQIISSQEGTSVYKSGLNIF